MTDRRRLSHVIEQARIWLGGLVGGVIWSVWSFVVNDFVVGNGRYIAAQNAGVFLKTGRYSSFAGQWIVILFASAIVLAHLYAWTRQTLGPGPHTALRIGFWVGFVAGFPLNFAQAGWPRGVVFRLDGCWKCGSARFWRRLWRALYTRMPRARRARGHLRRR
jgi:hypothetical protein